MKRFISLPLMQAAGVSWSCWSQTATLALERSVSLSHCSGAPTSNGAEMLRGLLPCQDISHLHSESTLAGLPSQAAVLKLTCESLEALAQKPAEYWRLTS